MQRLTALVALATLVVACAPAASPPRPTPAASSRSSAPTSAPPLGGEASAGNHGPADARPVAQAGAPGASARAVVEPRSVGPLVPVTLETGPGQQAEPFGQPRTLNLPVGWRARVFAAGLARPRLLAFDEHGVLHASQSRAGSIVALPNRDGDGAADEVVAVREGLQLPHGLVFRDGWLYVANTNGVVRLGGNGDGLARPNLERVVDGLPAGGGHFTRTLAIDPAGALYVSVGSSCNVCEESDPRRAAIVRYNVDGSGERLYARGLRNAVGLAWQPGSGELWATNNGRDWLGDDEPPETLNLVHDGDDFGWPRCLNGQRPDPEFGGASACEGVTPPRAEYQAHSAPLGLTFYPDANNVLVALHGSWNRSVPAAPRLIHILLHADGRNEVEDFATGWQPGQAESSRWGRPVDVLAGPDGRLYVSDDLAGAIYQLTPPR